MSIRAYRVAYDGRPFRGFQRQPDVHTVEDAVFDALRSLDVMERDADAPPAYSAAGRTDAGVSAVAQTMAFEAPEWLTPAALNGDLPPSIRAWGRADAADGFDARHDCVERAYTYHLFAPDADVARAQAVLDGLGGETDFHNLTSDSGVTVRDLRAVAVRRDGEFLVLSLRADGFLYQLVRRIAGLVREVAAGEASLEKVERVRSAEPLTGGDAVGAAPPDGLVLTDSVYPELGFEVDDAAAETARYLFEQRRSRHETNARVAGAIRDGMETG